jgi:hypothetical protein
MPIHIERLRCSIVLRAREESSPEHAASGPDRPTLEYAVPASQQATQAGPTPDETATERASRNDEETTPATRQADPRLVTDRVYEMMREELRTARMRGADV